MTKQSPKKDRVQDAVRTGPEWIILGVSALVLAPWWVPCSCSRFALRTRPSPPPTRPVRHGRSARQFLVPVDIVNHGDLAAAEVQVIAELTIAGETTTGDQVVDFLGGGERQQLTFVFSDDPADGELVISVTGYAEP